jgi:hypothetical protein
VRPHVGQTRGYVGFLCHPQALSGATLRRGATNHPAPKFVLDVFRLVSQDVAPFWRERKLSLPGNEPVLAQVLSISVECIDCGRTRWRRTAELKKFGVNENTKLADLSQRLFCTACRDDGLPGRHISVQASFVTSTDRERAEAYRLNSREVRGRGLPAIGA